LCEILPLAVGKVSTPPTPPCEAGLFHAKAKSDKKMRAPSSKIESVR